MWQEIARTGLRIDKNSDAQLISWDDNMLLIRHSKGLHVLEFSESFIFSKNLEFVMSFIPNSNASPVRELSDLGDNLTNANMTEMIVDPAYWSNNKQMSQDMLHFVSCEWIPCGYLLNEPVLATVNNVGNVDFYKPGRTDWIKVFDLSKIIVTKFGPEPLSIKDFPTLQKFISLLETSCVCLGLDLGNKSCYFVTAQKCGNIYIWKFTAVDDKLQTELIYELNQETNEILNMKCVPLSDKNFALICCNIMGQLFYFQFKTVNTSVILEKTTCLWEHKDRMICNYINKDIIDSKIVLICNKNRHLVVFMMDFDGNVLTQAVLNVNDYKICDIKERNGIFYITASNNKVFQVNINYSESLSAEVSPIHIELPNPDLTVHGFGLSENSVIAAATVYDCSVKYKGRPDVFKLLFYSYKVSFGIEINKIFQNKTKTLSNVWDCIELMRYKIIKQKVMPAIDYNQLYKEGQEDIYKLKLYYSLQIIYNMMLKSSRITDKELLPETSEETVKGMITALYAKTHLSKLYDKYKEHKKLDDFEMESFAATKNYLQYYSRLNNKDIHEFVSNNVLNCIKKDSRYECQCCDEILNGITCSNGHLNMFCSLSFIPIDDDNYLICKKCKATSRAELYQYKPRCIFCDHHLKYSS